jgi:hypothetical protein
MTVASLGMETDDPTALTLEPSMRMTWFVRTEPLFGSINLPALMAVTCDELDATKRRQKAAISESVRGMVGPPGKSVSGRSIKY